MLLTSRQLQAIQKIGESGMASTATIYTHEPYAKDPDNPFGDSDVTYGPARTVKCWLVAKPAFDISQGQGQAFTIAEDVMRVPVGTVIDNGDRVVILGQEYLVTDTTTEATWPEWVTVYLKSISNV
jgi:hypothetical protein